jgi:hypothetical protein
MSGNKPIGTRPASAPWARAMAMEQELRDEQNYESSVSTFVIGHH